LVGKPEKTGTERSRGRGGLGKKVPRHRCNGEIEIEKGQMCEEESGSGQESDDEPGPLRLGSFKEDIGLHPLKKFGLCGTPPREKFPADPIKESKEDVYLPRALTQADIGKP